MSDSEYIKMKLQEASSKHKKNNIILLLELFNQVYITIGLCSIMYVLANQPITKFVIITWVIVSLLIRIGINLYKSEE